MVFCFRQRRRPSPSSAITTGTEDAIRLDKQGTKASGHYLLEIPAGESYTIPHGVFGLGSITITVTASDTTKQSTAFLFGSLVRARE